MFDVCCNSPTELAEESPLPEERQELYFSRMATPDQLEKQIKDVEKEQVRYGQRIATIEGRLGAPAREGWFKRNAVWISPLLALVALALGGGFGLKFFSLSVGEQIDYKLKEPLARLQQLQIDIARIGV